MRLWRDLPKVTQLGGSRECPRSVVQTPLSEYACYRTASLEHVVTGLRSSLSTCFWTLLTQVRDGWLHFRTEEPRDDQSHIGALEGTLVAPSDGGREAVRKQGGKALGGHIAIQ